MKEKVTVFLFLIVIFGLSSTNLVKKDQKISIEERRTLQGFPTISFKNIVQKDTFDQFEQYTLDQFPFRNFFRSLKARTEYNMFQKLDYHGIFVKDSKIFKIEYPLNEKNVIRFTEKVKNIVNLHFKDSQVYYAIIPDKNYYLKGDSHLKLDYDRLYSIVNDNLSELSYIELRDLLSLDSYYDTDTHWRQEKLEKVVERMEKKICGESKTHQYQTYEYAPFYGVYYGQAALGGKGETLTYVMNDTIKNAYVKNSVDPTYHQVYKTEELGKMDSYNVFLSGSTPLITIENKEIKTKKELIIFRDSFASSITPMLIENYSKITLVDLRYISASQLSEVISTSPQDVLFLYSTMIINQSVLLKD